MYNDLYQASENYNWCLDYFKLVFLEIQNVPIRSSSVNPVMLYNSWPTVLLEVYEQVSDGGVHSHISHLFALLEAAKQDGVPNSFVHFFSDGRDTSPTSGGDSHELHDLFMIILL